MTTTDMQPLAGLIVLDLTRVRAGPTAARQLADWGADVIKIEPSTVEGEALGGPRLGPDFQNLHRNKRSLTLNLKDPRGREAFLRLAGKADVILENFRPDVKSRLGIDYEAVRAVNPRIIYASISAFGQDGPYAARPGFDQIAQGLGGLMSITGEPGQGPMRVGIAIADSSAGILCAQGVLLALLERQRSGIGQAVDTSLLQSQIFMLDFQAARWLCKGEVPEQAGNNHPTAIPTGVYPTKEGLINIATAGSEIWKRFCQVLGAEHFLVDDRYSSRDARVRNRDELNDDITAHLATDTAANWIEKMNAAGVPAGPIYTIDQVFADPQVRHLNVTALINSPHAGELTVLGQPIRMSRTPSVINRHPPNVGEHTEEVLAQFGFEQAEIESLQRAGVA